MKPLARRLLVPVLLLFTVLAVGAVAVGAWTNEDVVVVPAQLGDDGGLGGDGGGDAALTDTAADGGLFGDGVIFPDAAVP